MKPEVAKGCQENTQGNGEGSFVLAMGFIAACVDHSSKADTLPQGLQG
jgi:hypothetical protein